MLLNFKSLALLIPLLFWFKPVNALNNLSIEIQQLQNKNWQLHNISLSLAGLQNSSQQLSLLISKLSLQKPFSDIQIVDIRCNKFSWQDNIIDCEQGSALIKSKKFHSPRFSFSFSLTEQQSWFSIKNLKLANGSLSIYAKEKGSYWILSIKTKALSLKAIQAYIAKDKRIIDQIDKGLVNANIKVTGNNQHASTYSIEALGKQITLQAKQGKVATDSVDIQWDLQAKLIKGQWQWNSHTQLNQGELYLEPVYLKINDKALTVHASGKKIQNGAIQLQKINYIHPDVFDIKAEGLMINEPLFKLEHINISSEINDLDRFSKQYIFPFIEQTAFDGFNLKGQINLTAKVKQSKLTDVSININKLNLSDEHKRFGVKDAVASINWSNNPLFVEASNMSWLELKIRAIPINASHLKFLFKNKQLSLLEAVSIPLLDGNINIKAFKWQNMTEGEPKVYFNGDIQQLSLEKLSYALDWTPLSGKISGNIPGVNYENKTLTLKGELKAKLFGGTVKINNLTSSGLFTDFSKFSMDMQIENLDLYLLTKKFKMGMMEGRVSGFVNKLYLENWQPISFYAWLGTPENDNSRHRVSQKAVENIASIGGGGAADIISKGFLSFFDTFHYDRLGFGCYLYQGVCQLMGVEAAEQGYYLVKGGGLPRIDIKGYNTRLDWNVLMQRLSRISASDDVIVD